MRRTAGHHSTDEDRLLRFDDRLGSVLPGGTARQYTTRCTMNGKQHVVVVGVIWRAH